MKTLRRGVIALFLAGPVALTGCGGYEGDEPPAPFPGAGATSSAPAAPSDPDAPNAALESIAATASLTPTPGADPAAPAATPAPGAGQGSSGQTCAPARSRNTISIRVPDEVRSRVSAMRVQLLQGSVSRQVVFPVERPEKSADYGVAWGPGRYVVTLTGRVPMNAAWVPRARATVIIEGRTRSDAVDYRRTQVFSFRLGGPDASNCGRTPTFTHATALRPRDRIGIS